MSPMISFGLSMNWLTAALIMVVSVSISRRLKSPIVPKRDRLPVASNRAARSFPLRRLCEALTISDALSFNSARTLSSTSRSTTVTLPLARKACVRLRTTNSAAPALAERASWCWNGRKARVRGREVHSSSGAAGLGSSL